MNKCQVKNCNLPAPEEPAVEVETRFFVYWREVFEGWAEVPVQRFRVCDVHLKEIERERPPFNKHRNTEGVR